MMSENMISVDIKAYLDDLWEQIPEDKRQEFAEQIAREFDYSPIYDRIDEWTFQLCHDNNIPTQE